jgi:16S rRNA U1498 N3-methylase RsmE
VNIILFEATEVSSDQIVSLSGRRHKHVRDVLQSTEGDSLRVGVIDGATGTGLILSMNEVTLELRVELMDAPLPYHSYNPSFSASSPKNVTENPAQLR